MKTARAALWKGMTAVALLASALETSGLTAAEGEADTIVELPPLEVSASIRSTTPWQYLRFANVEILTRCSEQSTREFAEAHQRTEFLFSRFVPEEFRVKLDVPKIIVLSDRQSTPTASRDLITGYGSDGKGKPLTMNPAAPARGGAPTVRFLPNVRLNDVDVLAVFAILEEDKFDGNRIALTREHMRFLLEKRCPPLPAWLFEGLLALCETVIYEREALTFPGADWVTPAEGEKIRLDSDYPRTLLPMRDVLEPEFAPKADAGDTPRRWSAQCALFVRWAIDGNDPRRREAFWKFAARAGKEPVTEALFREHFGFGYSDMRDRLSDYLPGALKKPISVRADKLPKFNVPKPRLATEAEIGRLKGDWERLEIAFVKTRSPQYVARYEEQANATLTKALVRNGSDLPLLAVVALNECDAGRAAKARPMLEAVAKANLIRPRVYVELARLRYAEVAEHPAGANGQLDVAQANTALQPLTNAWKQLPPLAQTYDLAAEVWTRSEVKLSSAQLELLDEGLRYFPTNLSQLYRVAVLNVRNGREAEASVMAERGLRLSKAPELKERFEKLQATLMTRRAEARAPTAAEKK